jgi:hypothetical protein
MYNLFKQSLTRSSFVFAALLLAATSASFGWHTAVSTDADNYKPYGLIRVNVQIVNDSNDILRIATGTANTIIGSGILAPLDPSPDTNKPAVIRQFAIKRLGLPLVLPYNNRIISNNYVQIGLLPDDNSVEPNDIERIRGVAIDDNLPDLKPGDYMLTCTIDNISGKKAVAQKVIRITGDRPSIDERCLNVCKENQQILKKVREQNQTIDQTTKQTLKGTELHTTLLMRIIQYLTSKK